MPTLYEVSFTYTTVGCARFLVERTGSVPCTVTIPFSWGPNSPLSDGYPELSPGNKRTAREVIQYRASQFVELNFHCPVRLSGVMLRHRNSFTFKQVGMMFV
jgi:hypothetical protein